MVSRYRVGNEVRLLFDISDRVSALTDTGHADGYLAGLTPGRAAAAAPIAGIRYVSSYFIMINHGPQGWKPRTLLKAVMEGLPTCSIARSSACQVDTCIYNNQGIPIASQIRL